MARSNRTAQENEAITKKIELLMLEGFPRNQATAIAFRMFKDNELVIPDESQIIYGTKRRPQNKILLNQIADAFQILGLANLFKSNKNR